jgi:hypothetical protein
MGGWKAKAGNGISVLFGTLCISFYYIPLLISFFVDSRHVLLLPAQYAPFACQGVLNSTGMA